MRSCSHALPEIGGFSVPLLILAVVLSALFMNSKASLLLIIVTDIFAFYCNLWSATTSTDIVSLSVLPLTLVNLLAVVVIRYFIHTYDSLYEQQYVMYGKGTGMGLSVIHADEGHITVPSSIGTGSVFTIYLAIHA